MSKFTVSVVAATAFLAAASVAHAVDREGSNDEVDRAQQELKTLGFYKGPVDGLMGPQTRQAIAAYQRRNGLSVTSKLDHDTMQRLSSVTNSGSTGSTSSGSAGSTSATGAGSSPSAAVNMSGHPNGNPHVPGQRDPNEYSGSAKAPDAGVRK